VLCSLELMSSSLYILEHKLILYKFQSDSIVLDTSCKCFLFLACSLDLLSFSPNPL
jgi:hypothetical protein